MGNKTYMYRYSYIVPLLWLLLLSINASNCQEETTALACKIQESIVGLKKQEISARCSAAKTLGDIGAKAFEAVPALIKALKDDSWEVKRDVIYALRRMGKKAIPAIPSLIEVIKGVNSGSRTVRAAATEALGMLGEDAIEAVPSLIENLSDTDSLIWFTATRAIIAIGKKATPYLLVALQNKKREIKLKAIIILGELKASQAVPEFMKILESSEDDECRFIVVCALGKIGEPAATAIPILIGLFQCEDDLLRETAIFSLGNIAKKDKIAIKALESFIKSEKKMAIVQVAEDALKKLLANQ